MRKTKASPETQKVKEKDRKTRKDTKMITTKEAIEISKDFCEENPWYIDIFESRQNLNCHRFQIDDNLYFEYWGAHDWEFTILEENIPNCAAYYALAYQMTYSTVNKGIKYSELPSFIARCKAKVTAIRNTEAKSKVSPKRVHKEHGISMVSAIDEEGNGIISFC